MTGLMISMMGMVWRLGLEEVDTEDSTGKDFGMDSGFTDSIQGICLRENGLAGRAMDAVFILARMEAGMLGSLSGE